MVVGSLEVEVRIEGCRSLKEKRRAIRPIMDRLRREFRVSVAEVGDNELWNVSVIGVACVGGSSGQVGQVLEKIVDAFHESGDFVVSSVSREIG